ncbi:hypothetical protein TRFO_05407 [Tritrichomonas foetus]|uniref:Uncharacterized protein n=1 Tax=Tritrichomonas foetus TaxID=1144522 RepID=A0A1J4KAL2_9EUKA|nr:hypothetical protein TRFO_05407 [Tritrichomonas foetus]|eukprot:OHT06740.1 hypothetical protein TRFO_05407 [Tritrichomonas foetus]
MSGSDIATLLFTHMKVENEIRNVWAEIKRVREDASLPEPIRNIELARLFEVHNELEIESIRQQENYMKNYLKSLNLDEMNVKPITEGKLKCHLIQQMPKRIKQRATSYGFFDSYSDHPEKKPTNSSSSSFIAHQSDIITQRRVEIKQELRRMSFRQQLTPEEATRREDLVRQLKAISDQ